MPYTPATNTEIKQMLKVIGKSNVDELFDIIPKKYKYDINDLSIGESLSEQEVLQKMMNIADLNKNSDNSLCFLGGGSYDHYVPTVVDTISSRSEYYTAYTPYQPEVSQGTLQYLYEFQTMICELSGMEVANASLYDGASAVAEACSLAVSTTGRNELLLSSNLNPRYIELVKLYFKQRNVKIIYLENKNGTTSIADIKKKVSDKTAAIVIQSPNYFGLIEDWLLCSKNKKSSLLIGVSDPICLSVLKPPGECNCDVYVGEGQSLGNYMSFGGPYIGLFATKMMYARKMPGRIIGRTVDVDDKEAFVMTLQTREQHIRRERATSNICTNQGLLALRSTIYMALLGKNGIYDVANICFNNAQYAADKILKLKDYKLLFESRSFIKEFVVKTPVSATKIQEDALKEDILLHIFDYGKLDNLLLLAFTEKRSKEDIDKLVEFLSKYSV